MNFIFFKRIIPLLAVILIIMACNNSKEKATNYTNAYYEVLITRESISDTAKANPIVRDILKKYGYTEPDFRAESIKLFNDDPKGFTKIIDSVRKRAESEMIKKENKEKIEKDKLDSLNVSNSTMDSLKKLNSSHAISKKQVPKTNK